MTKKIPITDFEKGNCCPECGSSKAVLYMQYPMITEFDMKGKLIIRDYEGKRMHKPSNKRISELYMNAIETSEYQCANYECKKCGWVSEMYIP